MSATATPVALPTTTKLAPVTTQDLIYEVSPASLLQATLAALPRSRFRRRRLAASKGHGSRTWSCSRDEERSRLEQVNNRQVILRALPEVTVRREILC